MNSLSLLLDKPTPSSTSSQSESNVVNAPAETPTSNLAAAHLENIVKTAFDLLYNVEDGENNIDHPFIRKHISPSFCGSVSDLYSRRSLTHHVTNQAGNSGPRIKFLSFSTEFSDAAKTKATVWALTRFKCITGGLSEESVAVIKFFRKGRGADSVWICTQIHSIRQGFITEFMDKESQDDLNERLWEKMRKLENYGLREED